MPQNANYHSHGNRLDAADKQWHLSSPTPYDTPITYSGFLQARAVGNQIINLLEQTKLEEEVRNGETRRKRFKVVIHTSPFLRCVQTSVGISSGLAQTSYDSIYKSSDIIVPPFTATGQSPTHRTALLRIDSFLGEWLSPEYFELITPPPGPALMLGGAKAELLRREDYSMYTETTADEQPAPKLSRSLWQGSPSASPTVTPLPNSESEGALNVSSLAGALPVLERRKGYAPPRPIQPVQSPGKIPEGFVAHARDACTTVDYQWDSMREPLDFGDGGKFGEEWAAMHKRFRLGLRKLVNWYATHDDADTMVTSVSASQSSSEEPGTTAQEEDVETVLVLVSHGAGCNALMGAITHQPVLMDVATASLSMAVIKPKLDYNKLLETARLTDASVDYVTVDQMYQMRMSASTEHLQSNSSTPLSGRSGRSASTANGTRPPLPSSRGRTATFTNSGTVIGPFVATDYFSLASRSISASATGPAPSLRKEASERSLKGASEASATTSQTNTNGERPTSAGLWAPTPPAQATPAEPAPQPVTAASIFASSALEKKNSLYEDDEDNGNSFGGGMFPDFDNARFQPVTQSKPEPPAPFFTFAGSMAPSTAFPSSPMLAGPIRVQTDLVDDVVLEEVSVTPLGNGLGGFWGQPPPASETEPVRDMSHTKRRWTMNESV